jgi:hypothetical protein
MAKVELVPPFTHVRGRIGPLVYRKNGNGTAMSRMPAPSTAPLTPAQQQVRDQFRAAAAYAKAVVVDAVQGPRYVAAAAEKGMKPYPFAIRDFFNEPVVQAIDASGYHGRIGDAIQVSAFDDFEVTGVRVAILDGENNPIDQGSAVLTAGYWRFTATVAIAVGEQVTLRAIATDRPGHTGTLSVPLTIA